MSSHAAWLGIGGLALMWGTMMTVMMIPAAVPSTLTHARVSKCRLCSASYGAGYLGAWAAIGVAYALVHWALRAAGLMDMRLAAPAAGTLLIAAGAYQWSPLKARCVSRCRSPLGFMLGEWRDGPWGAFTMGLRYARWCVGCCWLVMAVLFVVGAMSLTWAAVISLFVLAERLLPLGSGFDRAVGAGLAVWGALSIAGAVSG